MRRSYGAPLLAFVLLAVAGGCGASSANDQSNGVPGAVSAAVRTQASQQRAVVSGTRDSRSGPVGARPAVGLEDGSKEELDSGSKPPANPCALVSRERASAIVGRPIASIREAPLGPTCIYEFSRPGISIRLAVQWSVSAGERIAQLRERVALSVGARRAYCGVAGEPTLLMPLRDQGLLQVTGPCRMAEAFASTAVAGIAG